jgi:hypothetical protein
LDLSQLNVLEAKPIQIARDGRFFFYSDVYVGFDSHREDLRSVLTIQLVTLQRSLPNQFNLQRGLSAIGWPSVVIGAASAVLAGLSYYLGTEAHDNYNAASTSPESSRYRLEAGRWSIVLTVSAAGIVALPLGSILLLVRPDPKQVQEQINKISDVLNSLPPSETVP